MESSSASQPISQKNCDDLIGEASRAATWTNNPALIERLVARAQLHPVQVLGAVERMTNEDQRLEALLQIADSSASILDAEVGYAWSVALSLQGRQQCRAIAALIPWLPKNLLNDAIHAVTQRTGESHVMVAAAALIDRLAEEQDRRLAKDDIPWRVMNSMYSDDKKLIHSLIALKRGYPDAVGAALGSVADVDNQFLRCHYLAAFVPRLPAAAFDRVIALLQECPARYRSDALLSLARHAPDDRLVDLLNLASDVEWEETPPEAVQKPWVRLTQEIGPRLVGRSDLQAATLAVAQAMRADRGAQAIETLAPNLTAESARQALRDIDVDWKRIDGSRSLMIAVGALVRCLPPEEAQAVVGRYIRDYCNLDHEFQVPLQPSGEREEDSVEAERLAPVAEFLPDATTRWALFSICIGMRISIEFATELTPALARLAPVVAANPPLVQEALFLMQGPAAWRKPSRFTVLSVLAPYLNDNAFDACLEAATRLM